MIKIGIFLV